MPPSLAANASDHHRFSFLKSQLLELRKESSLIKTSQLRSIPLQPTTPSPSTPASTRPNNHPLQHPLPNGLMRIPLQTTLTSLLEQPGPATSPLPHPEIRTPFAFHSPSMHYSRKKSFFSAIARKLPVANWRPYLTQPGMRSSTTPTIKTTGARHSRLLSLSSFFPRAKRPSETKPPLSKTGSRLFAKAASRTFGARQRANQREDAQLRHLRPPTTLAEPLHLPKKGSLDRLPKLFSPKAWTSTLRLQ